MNGSKEKITLRGVIRTYTRRLYPGDIYITEKRLEKHTKESLKQLLVGYISLKWLTRFLNTSGMAGFVWLALCSVTLVLTAVFLLVVLGLM
jgi:membrane-associated protease RseP (regulator of RpoE activity)